MIPPYLLTLVSILGGSGGPRAGIVSCLAAPQSEKPTKFFDPKRKSQVVLGIRFSKMYSPVKPVKNRISVFQILQCMPCFKITHYSYQIMYRRTYFGAKPFFLLHSNFALPPCTQQHKLQQAVPRYQLGSRIEIAKSLPLPCPLQPVR